MIISWNTYVRRSSSIAQLSGLPDHQIKPNFKTQWLKPLNYISAFYQSLLLIFSHRKSLKIIILVLPPNLLLYLIPFIKIMSNVRVLLDCHNGTFLKKWMSFPLVRYYLKQADTLFIHNDDLLKSLLLEYPRLKENTLVVPDPPAISRVSKMNKQIEERIIVFPASFSYDEPIDHLIESLSTAEFQELDCTVYITGPSYKLDRNKLERLNKIRNVVITGFLDLNEYENLLSQSSAVLALTDVENIQLCATNEAIGYLSVPIYSNTKTLSKMYSNVGLPVAKNLSDLSDVLARLFENYTMLQDRVLLAREQRTEEWKESYLPFLLGK